MPQYSSLVQRTFVKGLNASTDLFDQVRGSVPKLSNMLFTVRGSLKSIFGAAIIAAFNGSVPIVDARAGAIKRMLLTIDINNNNYRQLFFLQDSQMDVGNVVNLQLTATNTGSGSLVPGTTYTVKVAPVDSTLTTGAPSHPIGTIGSAAMASLLLPAAHDSISVTWNAQPGPAAYVVTVQVAGLDKFVAIVPNVALPQQGGVEVGGPVTVTFSLTVVPIGSATIVFGGSSVMNVVVLRFPAPDAIYSQSAVAIFPAGPANQALPPIGGGTFGTGASDAFSACGGVVGLTEAVPDMVEFANELIILLGNGYPPQYTILDPVAPTVNPVSNSFTASYPTWTGGVTNLVGDNIVPTVPNGLFFTCIQAGITGGVEPTWPTVKGQTVVDNQVIWQCARQVTGSPPPRNAAHGIYYAGSFWVFNTNPNNTSDGIDGPSSLRMSDIDNINSWNPVNQAFIGKDDGSEGMGMATFTIAETGIPPTGSLVLFKNFSTYQVLGVFGAPDLAIQQIQSDMGCVSPRSIQFLSGFGIVRLAHLGFALFNGVRDNLISEEIRPYLFGDNPQQAGNLPAIDWTYAYLSQSTQVVNPPMFVCAVPIGSSNGALRRLLCYDMVLRAWTILDFPSNITPDLYIRSLYQIRSPGSQPITIAGSGLDGTIFRLFYGDSTWTDGVTPVAWAFTTPEAFNQQSPRARIYIRKMRLTGRYLGNSNPAANPISIGLVYDGSDPVGEGSLDTSLPSYNVPYQLFGNANGFVIEVDVGEKMSNIHALVSGTGQVEIDSVEWLVKPEPSTTVPPRIT